METGCGWKGFCEEAGENRWVFGELVGERTILEDYISYRVTNGSLTRVCQGDIANLLNHE